ncbi:MAG: T9SS type A sorting domain-containing protein [Cytophagales bacterium]|nr:T9SS type A sorting domain-containing protein [Cytophagales bacterium]
MKYFEDLRKTSLLTLSAVVVFLFSFTEGRSQDWYTLTEGENVNYYEVVETAEKYYATHGTGKGTGYKLYQRWKYFAERIMDDNGHLPSPSEILNEKRRFDRSYRTKSKRSDFAGDWSELGPFSWQRTSGWNPGIGRIVSIAVEENNQDLIFAGSPGGGIWRTRNGGQLWEPLGDEMSNLSIFAIGIDPFDNNNVYALNSAGRILKSTNQGDSWTEIHNTGSSASNARRFAFHPTQQGTFMVSAGNGVWKTTNNGNSFTRTLTTSVEDVYYKPNDPSIVYACGRTFFKSTNGGDSFAQKMSGLTANARMRMTVTPANPNYVYVVQADGGSFGSLSRSNNSGESFTRRNAQNPPYFTQAGRDMAIMASTTNAEEIHVAGMNNHRSLDGGNSFVELAKWSNANDPSYIHADVEVMLCVNDVFYAGTDGGIYRSTNNGDNYTDLSSLGGLAVHQFYRISGFPGDPELMIGGSQDNGVNIMKNKSRTWLSWLGADGMECFFDHTNPNIVYGATQNGSLNKSTNGGQTRFGLTAPESNGNWVTPFEMDPIDGNKIYVGYTNAYRSNDGGNNWTNLTNSINIGGNIDELTVAPSNNNYIYLARRSNMWVTTNGQNNNPSWTSISNFQGNVNYITVDPNDPQRVAIACSGSRVYVSTNGGSTWVEKTMNLPVSGANCVVFDAESNNGLYVGTGNAVYYTNDNLTEWLPFSSGLPNATVNELEIHYASKTIRVGTYGRGMWESGMYGSALAPSIASSGDFIFCEGNEVELTATVENQATVSYTYEWKRDGETIANETSPRYIATESGNYTVVVSDGDAVGESSPFAVTVIAKPEVPNVLVTPSCGPGQVILRAESNNQTLYWYANANDEEAEYSGDDVSLDLTSSSTLYLEARTEGISDFVGPQDNTFGDGGNHAGGFYLVFDVEKAMRLKSAIVYAEGTKERTLELRDVNDVLITSKVINIEDGEQKIDIDITIPAGTGYKIGFVRGADLYRSNTDLTFPYTLDGLAEITGSTAPDPTAFYYYLYNWEVEEIFPVCVGDRVAVEAEVIEIPEAPFVADATVCAGDESPVTLVAEDVNGQVRWYQNLEDTIAVRIGNEYVIDSPVDNVTLYVDQTTIERANGGVLAIDTAMGVIHGGGYYLVFDVTEPVILSSVTVFAEEEGERVLELRNADEQIIDTKTIFVNAGESILDLNLELPVGEDLQLGFSAGGANLFRSNVDLTYPYQVGNHVTITSSTAGEEYYYYLYNWEVQTIGFECASEKVEANLRVEVCTGIDAIAESLVSVYPNPSNGRFSVSASEDLDVVNMRIVDVTGKVIAEHFGFESQFDLAGISKGIYFIQVNTTSKTYQRKIIIE